MSRMKRLLGNRTTFALGAWVVYVVAFAPLYRQVGPTVTALAVLPVMVMGWLFGMRSGLLAGLLAFLLDVLLINLMGEAGWDVMLQRGLPGTVLLFLVGAVVGRLHDLGEQVRRELVERRRVEKELRDTVAELTAIHHHAPVAMLLVDRERRVRKVNNVASQFAGRPADEMLGLYSGEALRCLHHLDDPEGCGFGPACATCPVRLAVLDTFADGQSRRDVEAWLPFPRGDSTEERCLLVSTAYLRLGGTERVLVCAQDITDRKRAEREIEERQLYLEGVLRAAPDAIVTLDAHHRIVEWNAGAERLFGYSREEVIGQNIDDLITRPDVVEEAVGFTQTVLGGGEVRPTETVRYRKDGSAVDVIVAGSPILVGDELIGVVAVYTDISERKRMEEQLAHIATHDFLTDLPNRLLLNDRLSLALAHARRHRQKVALMMLDLDYFKQVNDTLGHSVGDQLLQVAGERLTSLVRESDTVARMGGDEFTLILPEVAEAEDAVRVAEKILNGFQEPFILDGHEINITTSIGIAIYPDDGEDGGTLMKNADIAMYRAKQEGRNNYQRYSGKGAGERRSEVRKAGKAPPCCQGASPPRLGQ